MIVCKGCGESAVDEDEKVCTSCGVVIDGITFGSESIHNRITPRYSTRIGPLNSYVASILKKPKSSATLTYALNTLSNLCHQFNIASKLESEVAEILKNIYKIKRFHKKEDVGKFAGCILYFVLKTKYEQPIPLIDVVQHLQCTKKKFLCYLNFLKSWLCKNEMYNAIDGGNPFQKKELSDPNLPSTTKSMISAVCENALPEEKCKLLEMTTDTVKLAFSCWLGSGRSSRSIVVACTYLCWKFLNLRHRKKSSFLKFCSEFKILKSSAGKRISELEDLLLQLGKSIPSCSEHYINKRNLIFHFGTILKNSETLRFNRLDGKFSKEEINQDEYSTFRTSIKKPPREVSESAVNYDSDMNASDIEISDTEIDEYINYSAQKKVIKDLCEKTAVKNT